MVNLYNLLKVSPAAAEEEIKKAINRELRVWSNRTNAPQIERRQEAERMVKQLEEAEGILLDAAKRKEYDLQLQAAPTATGRVDETVIHEGGDLVQEGWRLLIAGNIAEAISVATQATQRDSGNPEAWALLGQAKYRWGEIEDAIYEYKRAINLRPNEASYYFDLGCVYESAERWQDSLLQFQRAAQIDPSTTMYRAAIGAILIKNEKYPEGIEILERCVQEEPDNASYKWYLAIAYLDSRFAGWVFDPEDHMYLCISKDQADTARALVQKAKALNVADPELAAQIRKADVGVENLYKRRFKGSWIMVGIWGLCYLVPGLLWYLVNLRPQYKINKDVHDIEEMGKKDYLVGGEVGVYFSALPPGMRWASYSLPRFVVWFLILLLSPITFFYLLYDNYLSDGGSIDLHDLGLSRDKVPVAAAVGLGVIALLIVSYTFFSRSSHKPVTKDHYVTKQRQVPPPTRTDPSILRGSLSEVVINSLFSKRRNDDNQNYNLKNIKYAEGSFTSRDSRDAIVSFEDNNSSHASGWAQIWLLSYNKGWKVIRKLYTNDGASFRIIQIKKGEMPAIWIEGNGGGQGYQSFNGELLSLSKNFKKTLFSYNGSDGGGSLRVGAEFDLHEITFKNVDGDDVIEIFDLQRKGRYDWTTKHSNFENNRVTAIEKLVTYKFNGQLYVKINEKVLADRGIISPSTPQKETPDSVRSASLPPQVLPFQGEAPRWPWTSTRLIREDDLSPLSHFELDLMRNEIYARHGWIFKRKDLQDYFSSKSWYRARGPLGDRDNMNKMAAAELNQIERQNTAKILQYQKNQQR